MQYAGILRWNHSLLALCMVLQLLVGELMDVPGEGAEHEAAAGWIMSAWAHSMPAGTVVEESWMFEVHEFLGLTVVALLLVRLMLALTDLPGANWRHLLPWCFADGRRALKSEISSQMAGWKQGKLAPPEEGETVARSVHGLMLLTAMAIGTAGVILFFGWNEHGHQSELIEFVGETHELLVGVFEALLAAHVLAVILHQRQGHDIVSRIKP